MRRFVLGDGVLTEEDKREIAQRNARITRDADPLVLRRIARWENHHMLPGRASSEPPTPLPMAIRPQSTHFDQLSDWYCGYLGVRQEFESPYEMQQDLKQGVPQAILRDIFRPVMNPVVEWEHPGEDIDPAGCRALAEAKAAQKREPLPRVVSALAVFLSEQRRRRRLMRTPWQPKRPDDAPRHHSSQAPIQGGATGPATGSWQKNYDDRDQDQDQDQDRDQDD